MNDRLWPVIYVACRTYTVYNVCMKTEERKILEYLVACISEFSHRAGVSSQEAFRYLNTYGGIDFLLEYYDTEHILSFDDVVDDLMLVTQKSGGKIA